MKENGSISDQVQRLRRQLNLSQEELATRLGVSFATVNRWEAGKSNPQRAQIVAIERLAAETEQDGDFEEPLPGRGARRRRGVQKSSVLGNRGMEQMLWDAACSIRGQQDAPKFKEYILPLLFIKRLSDVFDDEIERLTQKFGDRDTALEIVEEDHSLVRFYVPLEARWAVVSGRETFDWPRDKVPKTLGEQLTATIRSIVKNNRDLAGVIDIVDYNETRNGEREISDAALKQIIEQFSDPRYRLGLQDVEPDFLGRCYEYLLRKFAEGQGQSAGEFFTPTEVGFLMAEILRPRPGEEAYDYACGSFGLLIKLQLVSRRLDPTSKVPLKLYGQELTGSTYAIACMNRIIHDMDGEVRRGDSMLNPKFRSPDGKLQKFDIVVANPMWNQPIDPDVYEQDGYDRFLPNGGITGGKADWAWLQHTVASLKDNGRSAIVLDTGAVTRGSGSKNEDKERNIRRWFVEHDLIDGVILLPDNLFYNTTAAGVILVLSRRKPKERRGRIVLINASDEFKKGTPKNYLAQEGMTKISEAFKAAMPIPGFAAVLSPEELAAVDYNLSPARHIGALNQATGKSAGTRYGEAVQYLTAATTLSSETDLVGQAAAIPESEVLTMGELIDEGTIEVVTGFPSGQHNSDGNGVPHIRPYNVTPHGTIDLRQIKWVQKQLTDRQRLRPNDIVFNNTNTEDLVGKTALWTAATGECAFSNHMTRIRVLLPEKVSPAYLAVALHAHWLAGLSKQLCRRHVAQASIIGERFREIRIPLASPKQQVRFAKGIRTMHEIADSASRAAEVMRDVVRVSLLDQIVQSLD